MACCQGTGGEPIPIDHHLHAAQSVDDLLPAPPAPHPRTARVNTLRMLVAEALTWLRDPPAEHAGFAKLVWMLPPSCCSAAATLATFSHDT